MKVNPVANKGIRFSHSYATRSAVIGARHYASSSNGSGLNKYSRNITEPKSQGASQAMCK
jgi:hypothetical protein